MVRPTLHHTKPLDVFFEPGRGGWVETGTQNHEACTPTHYSPGKYEENHNLHDPSKPMPLPSHTVGGHMPKYEMWRRNARFGSGYVNPFAGRGILSSIGVALTHGEHLQQQSAKAGAHYAARQAASDSFRPPPTPTAPGTNIPLRGGWPINSMPPPPHPHKGPTAWAREGVKHDFPSQWKHDSSIPSG